MTLRNIASLAIALLLGLIAVLMVRNFLVSQKPGPAEATAGMTPVVVAALPVERGAELKPAMLKIVNYPHDAVPAGAFQSVEQLTAGKDAAGRTALRSMAANEPVLLTKLSGAGGRSTLSGALAPGMRAISVRSSDVTGVAGFVLPGDRVDIFITRSSGVGDGASTITQVLAENVLVLGVDQTSDQEADKPVVAKVVTVEVSPDQAQALSLGQAVGQVNLSLRSLSDGAPLTRRVTTIAELGGPGGGVMRKASYVAPRHGRIEQIKAALGLTEVRVTRGVETSGYPVAEY